MNNKKVLKLAVDIGYQLLRSGAEIFRVEESIGYICKAYGLDEVEVFVIPATIIATANCDGEMTTVTKRLHRQQVNFDKVNRLNALSRYICATRPDEEEVTRELGEIINAKGYSKWLQWLGFAAVGFFFTLLFGGTITDALFAFGIGALTSLVIIGLGRQRTNPFFINIICGFVVALLAQWIAVMGWTVRPDKIIIGVLMNLVPGVALTNGIRDFITGDLYGGISKMLESLLIATAIALGAAVALASISFAGTQPSAVREFEGILQVACAFLASCGFAIHFEVRGRNLLWGAVGGGIGWLIFVVTGMGISSVFLCYIFAGFAISLFSEVAARVLKAPTIVFLVVAFIPLVPGGDAYKTMEYCILGEYTQAALTGLHMMAVAGCIVLGVFFAGSIVKWIYSYKKKDLKAKRKGGAK